MRKGELWAEVAFNSRDPVYLQVVRLFKERIATGDLQPGQVIPSRREIAAALKINPNTAQKAYKEMEEQRLIVTEGNSPSRITRDSEIFRSIRSELIGGAVEAFLESVRSIDVPLDELLELVRRKYAEVKANKQSGQGGEGHD
ncbi:GntR family transcriptional regulator [Cohnella thermotolerans]|uniref:GntR family transcriptional regulator n=1 Tax=Cohnella thermotolerans TaxID=329858 RepID=UPI000401F8E7|nr:GntR family transcriptional regulator [Cohnella thermotolerans]